MSRIAYSLRCLYLALCVPCIMCTTDCLYPALCVPCIVGTLYHAYHGLYVPCIMCTLHCMYLVSCVPWIVCTLGSASQCVLHIAQSFWSSPVGAHCSALYHINSTLLLKSIGFAINHSTQCMNRRNTFAETVERAGHHDQYLVLCVGELLHVLLQVHYMN